MKRIAFVPWSKEFMDDAMFDLSSSLNRDNCFMMWVGMKNYLEDNDWEVHTVDKYNDISTVDIFVFFTFYRDWYKQVREKCLEDRTIYIAFEPAVVDENHSPEGINKLLHYFKYIITWNDDLVDNNRIFKFMYPYFFDVKDSKVPFSEKKFLVNISGNKISSHKLELYSHRRRVIDYFDSNNGFELYGTGWEKDVYNSYKGLAKVKAEVYSQFKFALCLENMTGVNGYVTEKILDCFCASVVPIYLGPSNIAEYIPDDAYIHFEKYDTLDDLNDFLKSINEEEYNTYIQAAKKYLEGDQKRIFYPEEFGKVISKVASLNSGFVFSADGSLTRESVAIMLRKVIGKIKKVFNKYLKNRGGGSSRR